jgi:hypothetical protein
MFQLDQDIFDECINVNKNTTKNTSQPLFTTTNNKDDKVNNLQDDFHLKVSLVEKESMPSKDALKALCFILEQQKLQKSKAYREKLVYDICFGPSDESDDDDSDYRTE